MLPDNVIVTSKIADSIKELLGKFSYSKIGVLMDENTKRDCLPMIKGALREFTALEISSGEKNKTLSSCETIWSLLSNEEFDRKSLIINLGGGVICDLGGFVATTFKRGVDFVNIPTTLLSQVDASIGGKNGIDFSGFKNQIGLFRDPLSVIINSQFLQTLPERQLRSGFAEVIKHSLIADAKSFYAIQEIDLEKQNWDPIILKSLELKHRIVSQDPYENNIRKALNFGHTLGHAIETCFLKSSNSLLHGEAIAIGMICESFLSSKLAGLSKVQLDLIVEFILRYFNHIQISKSQEEEILIFLRQDKKNEKGKINFTLIPEIGKVEINRGVVDDDARKSITFYNDLKLSS